MPLKKEAFEFVSTLSFDPLLTFWEKNIVPGCSYMASMYKDFKKRLQDIPELNGTIKDIKAIERHRDVIVPLMSCIFPQATWENEISGALVPYSHEPAYVSPAFKKILIDSDGSLKGHFKQEQITFDELRSLRAFLIILDKIYGIKQSLDLAIIRIVPDEKTGLDRYFRLSPDFSFIDVIPLAPVAPLTDYDKTIIKENITAPDILARYIYPSQFELRGFTVVRAVDVSDSEILSSLEKDLIDQESIFCADGFRRLTRRIRTLFNHPRLKLCIGVIYNDNILIIKDSCPSSTNCVFTNSTHIRLSDLRNSIWLKAIEQRSMIRIPDLASHPNSTIEEQMVRDDSIKSVLSFPLYYQGDIIGMLELQSDEPGDLGPIDVMIANQIHPLFSVALKRGIEEMNNEIQSIIKEKCTAIHPSVEWRFKKAAINLMKKRQKNSSAEMENIIFKDVIPFYGQTDIRGSSHARNKAISQDLVEQLGLARDILKPALDIRPWPLLKELDFRIEDRIKGVQTRLNSGDESLILAFLRNEIESNFKMLAEFGPKVAHAIEKYKKSIDPEFNVIYHRRRDFEESVSILNEKLSAFLDQEEAKAQSIVSHYFEKRQTDGIDYIIYLGQSMIENGKLDPFHIQNFSLWQLNVACGMGWHTEQIKSQLKVKLDTCHLILFNHLPLSIRFRYAEKRFDVDGAYNIRYEIIKSRLDKAIVKGTNQRLTQPGQIAIVYTHPEEAMQIQRHVDFLQSQKMITKDVEFLEIDDLQEISGLKAIRLKIDLKQAVFSSIDQRMVG